MTTIVDETSVLRVLGDAFPGPVRVTKVAALTGGASAETCAVDVVDGAGVTHALILRRSAGDPSLVFDPGVRKREEALTQAAGARHGVPAAEVLAIFEGDVSLGDGYVMRRLEGETIPRKLMRDDRFAGARKVLIDECARALAAIHRTPVSELPLAPAPSVTSQLDTLESLHRGFGVPVPTFSLVFRWLRSRIPPARESALVHGDFRTGNLLVDERGLAAVLDWELVHLGDPLEDLGWFCVPAWRFGSPLPAGGFGDRASFFAAYERAAGVSVDPDHARFWEVFGTLRWGVICQWQAFAHLEGRAPSVERAAIGRRVTEVELDLLLLLEGKL